MNFNFHQKGFTHTLKIKSLVRGFTLIEILVGTAVFILVALAAYQSFGVLMNSVSVSRAKIAATAIANEKFEIIRNLPYQDVGIIGGLPAGKITRTENVLRDNYSFTIVTSIRSIDDPFDGTIDGIPNDCLLLIIKWRILIFLAQIASILQY
ncbi:MAG: prepilin-type N-terminal cleavage/methylation domain-containing protein [Candidatus Paceibacterota bacterium]